VPWLNVSCVIECMKWFYTVCFFLHAGSAAKGPQAASPNAPYAIIMEVSFSGMLFLEIVVVQSVLK
jgi:hypothetical protein